MFGKNKVDLTQNFFSPFSNVKFGKLYDKGKITEVQYLNSVSLSFGVFTAINEKANKEIEEYAVSIDEDRDEVIEAIDILDKMTPDERQRMNLQNVKIKSYSMSVDNCKLKMEIKKALYYANLGVLYSSLEGVFSPDTVNAPVSGMNDDILEDVYLAATLKEAIDFVKNDQDLFERTSVFEYKGPSLDEIGECIKRGENPPQDEIIVKNTYEDFLSKKAFENTWEIAKRMRDILTLAPEGDIFEDRRFFDENGFILTEDGHPIETRLEALYRGVFLRKLVDTKGYEKLFDKI